MFKKEDCRNELTILCDELENCNNKICRKDEIVCVKKMLREHIGNDYGKLLKIKAELKMHEETVDTDNNNISFFISSAALILTTLDKASDDDFTKMALILLGLFVFILIVTRVNSKKYGYRRKWKAFIAVVLEDMEKEWDKEKH